MVGFLPAVREELIRAGRPRERPPLSVCERPKEIGPDGSTIVNDLRAVLLEVVSEPPRLRQDQDLFQKEMDRFLSALEPWPAWLLEALKSSDEARLIQAMAWARILRLVKEETEGKQIRLQVSSRGQKWLSDGLDEQYAKVFDFLRSPATLNDPYGGISHSCTPAWTRTAIEGPATCGSSGAGPRPEDGEGETSRPITGTPSLRTSRR